MQESVDELGGVLHEGSTDIRTGEQLDCDRHLNRQIPRPDDVQYRGEIATFVQIATDRCEQGGGRLWLTDRQSLIRYDDHPDACSNVLVKDFESHV